jgi:hypothetical protein
MNSIHQLALVFVCTSLLLTGCTSASLTVPTYPQDHIVTDIRPFGIAINKCYWIDGPLQGKIPKDIFCNFAPELQEMLLSIPSVDHFLITEFTVTNIGTEPAVFPGDVEGDHPLNHPPVFDVRDTTSGAMYTFTGRGTCLLADFIMNNSVVINPGHSTKGFLAFALRPGDYEINVYSGYWVGVGIGRYDALNRYDADVDGLLFHWTLNPSRG